MTGFLDFLFELGQTLCLLGLLYGAYLCIRFQDTFGRDEAPEKIAASRRARAEMPLRESFGHYID